MAFRSRKIAFLVIYTEKTDGESYTKSKNYLSYIAAELVCHKEGDVFWGKDEDTLLKKAHEAGFDYGFIIREGTVFCSWEQFLVEVEKEWTDDHFCMGHILDRKEKYFEVHNQTIFLDLKKWGQLGCPSYKKDLNTLSALTNVRRSADDFHDDYTPTWIEPGTGTLDYQNFYRGGQWISMAFAHGYKVSPFSWDAREQKEFYYPEDPESFEANKVFIHDHVNTDSSSFFLYNTEQIYDNPNIGPLDKLIIPASGLMPFYLLKHFGHGNVDNGPHKTLVILYDVTHFQLETFRKIIRDWDGRNYRAFVESICGYDLLKGQTRENDDRAMFNKYFGSEDEFCEWFAKIKETCVFEFVRTNALSKSFQNQPWLLPMPEQNTYLSLSNIFHYWPTSIELSYRYRMKTLNELMMHLLKNGPETWVNYCSLRKDERGRLRPYTELIQAIDFEPIEIYPQPWEADLKLASNPVKLTATR